MAGVSVVAVVALFAASAAVGKTPQSLISSLASGNSNHTGYVYPPACCTSGTYCAGPPQMQPLHSYCCTWGPIVSSSQSSVMCVYQCGGPGCCGTCGVYKCLEACPMQGTTQPA